MSLCLLSTKQELKWDLSNTPKKGRDKEGKKMVRKTETTKPLTSQKCCPFNFTFKYSNATDSLFLKGGTSCARNGSHASETKACLG
jgi:hypothetical protein